MANYKIVDGDKLDADLKQVADAIRAKSGYADPMVFPDEFVQEIAAIPTGGGSSADVRYVTFRNEWTGEEFVKPVFDGDDCMDVVAKGLWATPTKESTAQYDFAFLGWGEEYDDPVNSDILKNITEDKTVYAIFKATVRTYTITYLDEDGVTVLSTKQVAYGTVPSYTPSKTGYGFGGWTPTPTAVKGDASYVASWYSVLASGTCGTSATWELSVDYVLTISGSGAMTNYGTGSQSSPWIASYAKNIKKIVIGDGITNVGNAIAYGCSNLETVIIPNSVTKIGKNAFYLCQKVTSFTIPNNVTEIGESAFRYNRFESITIPSSVSKIYKYAFADNTSLKNATFQNTSGWFVTTTNDGTSGTNVDVSNKSTAATYLATTYYNYFWGKS